MKALLMALALSLGLLLGSGTHSPILAQDSSQWRPHVAALSTTDSCWSGDSKINTSAQQACRSVSHATSGPLLAGVTCGANQWCCKHDIGGTGECTKCCNK
jgi:hypothetical protein